MLSEKTALSFQDVVRKLKKAPLEAYTTPAGALGGVLLTKLLRRKPELRHYLASGALGAGAGYAGGRIGRHFLEGYRRERPFTSLSTEQKKQLEKRLQRLPGIAEAPSVPVGRRAEEAAEETAGMSLKGPIEFTEEELPSDEPLSPSFDVAEEMGEEMRLGRNIAEEQARVSEIFKLLTPEERKDWQQAKSVGAAEVLQLLTKRALVRRQEQAQMTAGGPVTGEAKSLRLPAADVEMERRRQEAAARQRAAELKQRIRQQLESKYR